MISNGALPAWETAATSLAPRLWTALCARNARSPVCLAMLDDLASDELADGLEGILGRALVSEDLAELSLLMPVAVGFTCLKRRRVNDALRKPWLIPDLAPASLFSERELLQAKIAAKVPDSPETSQSLGKLPDAHEMKLGRRLWIASGPS